MGNPQGWCEQVMPGCLGCWRRSRGGGGCGCGHIRGFPCRPPSHWWGLVAGYTTEVGRAVLQKDAVTVVTGAPRYKHRGAVYLLSRSPQQTLQRSLLLPGHQVGSYFGSAVALADLNNDG